MNKLLITLLLISTFGFSQSVNLGVITSADHTTPSFSIDAKKVFSEKYIIGLRPTFSTMKVSTTMMNFNAVKETTYTNKLAVMIPLYFGLAIGDVRIVSGYSLNIGAKNSIYLGAHIKHKRLHYAIESYMNRIGISVGYGL